MAHSGAPPPTAARPTTKAAVMPAPPSRKAPDVRRGGFAGGRGPGDLINSMMPLFIQALFGKPEKSAQPRREIRIHP